MSRSWTPPVQPRAVLFDFDGVVLETTEIKTRAFRTLFAGYPEQVEAIVEYHREHLGASRFVKFDHIFRRILGRELGEEERLALGERFSELVVEEVARAPAVPGAFELLERLHGRVPAFVVSGTPRPELEMLIERRGLAHLFTEIHGSPETKEAIIRDILGRHGFEAASVLLVGDGLSDYRAARATGLGFVARISSDSRFGDLDVPRIDDLRQLDIPMEPAT